MFGFTKKKSKQENDQKSGTTKETSYTKNIQTNNGSTTITSTTVQTMRQFSQVQTQRSETRFSITGSESASELLRTINFPELPSRLSNLQIDAKPFQPGSSASRPAIKNTPTTPASSFARQSPQYSSYQSPYFNRTYSKYSNSNEKSPPLTLTHSATQGAIAKQQPYVSSGSLQSLGSTPKSIVPTYNTNGKRRGKLLLINNTKFETNEERKGAAKDGKDLKAMFKNIGFNVDEAHKDLKSDQMLKKITQFRKDSSLEKYDMSVVVIMSHGNNFNEKGNPVPGGYTQIFGTDEVGILVDDILDQFSSEKCKYLKGKPKIFIFQCCRGTEDEFIAKDSGPTKNVIKQHSDMLIAFSTLPGYLSNRDPLKGTWYIQSICEVFNAHAKDFDIEALLKIVDERLSKKHPKYKQTSTYESRGFKRCYLNPVN